MTSNRSRLSTRVSWPSVLLVLATALLLAAPALAGQRIEFKNGQVLVVKRVRFEGEVAYLTLADGSEIGFPRALIKEAQAGFDVKHPPFEARHSGRGPSVSQLRGYKRILGEAGYPSKVIARGVLSGNRKDKKKISVGFRYKGSVDISEIARETAAPTPIWEATRVAGGGQVTPAHPGAAPTRRPVRREKADRIGMPMQVHPKKKGMDGFVRDPRTRWE